MKVEFGIRSSNGDGTLSEGEHCVVTAAAAVQTEKKAINFYNFVAG